MANQNSWIASGIARRAQAIARFWPTVREKFGECIKYDKFQYLGALTKTTATCTVHGDFLTTPSYLVSGFGCPQCGKLRSADTRRKPISEWLDVVAQVHNRKYTYPTTSSYTHNKCMMDVICPIHGAFRIKALKHLQGQGCSICGGTDKAEAKNTFLQRAKSAHGDKYDYSCTVYLGGHTKTRIMCKKHGLFSQTPNCHVNQAQGCPSCGNILSKQEQKIADYLSVFTTVVQRDRTLIAPKELDIYLPEHKIAVEYCGMYWHSHKDAIEERKNKHNHYNKYMACKALGIRLITIYEDEWEQWQGQIKRLLRNAIGKTKGKLMARKCEVRVVPTPEARVFYEKYHPQGGNGGGHHYGLYWKGALVACMRFAFGNNDRGAGAKNQTWTLGRYATRVSVAGAASRLFNQFLIDKQPKEVKSFSDNRYFEGGMYLQLEFTLDAEAAPDYQVWSPKIGLQSKPYYQRRNLPKRIQEHGLDTTFAPATDPRTEAEMTYAMGCGRIYDCGKRRWVWKNRCLQSVISV